MSNEEKITVIQASSNNLWLKPPRVFLVLVPIILLVVFGMYLYRQNKTDRSISNQDIKLQPVIDPGKITPLDAPERDIGGSGVGYPPPGEDE